MTTGPYLPMAAYLRRRGGQQRAGLGNGGFGDGQWADDGHDGGGRHARDARGLYDERPGGESPYIYGVEGSIKTD